MYCKTDINDRSSDSFEFACIHGHIFSFRFPMASPENLSTNGDDCAICWDKMENARKLPCGHLFHK